MVWLYALPFIVIMSATAPPLLVITIPLGFTLLTRRRRSAQRRLAADRITRRATGQARGPARARTHPRMEGALMKDGPMDVYLDSSPENITSELALTAERVLDDRWNGWLRPLATAAACKAFVDAWRRNDPNGIGGYVTEVGDSLVCSVIDSDEPADEFPRAGQTEDGTPLYDLTGWVWVNADRYGNTLG